jgi:hypothetical protein
MCAGETRLDMLGIEYADRLADEPLSDLDVIHPVAVDLGRVDVVEVALRCSPS